MREWEKFTINFKDMPLREGLEKQLVFNNSSIRHRIDRLCGLVVRVPGYRSRDADFDFRQYHIF
jgi:hypothetical protein